jgi:hypothetical protein
MGFATTALCALAIAAMLAPRAQAAADQVQYVFKGECNGLLHWVSMLYDRPSNSVSTVILRAKCPYHETQSFSIFRRIAIPVNLGGRYSEIIKQSGIDHYIDGHILSPGTATLKHKGPKTVLTCGSTEIIGPPLKVPVCERFKLTAQPSPE